MYGLFVFLFLILPAVYLAYLLNKRGFAFKYLHRIYLRALKEEAKSFSRFTFKHFGGFLPHAKRILFYFTAALALILIVTGFIPPLIGKHLYGIFLLVHILAAPFFCAALALLILLFAGQHSLGKEDIFRLKGFSFKDLHLNAHIIIRKISFWVFAFFSIPAIASIALSLFPIFGTEGLDNLLLIHQISVLFLALSFFFYSFSLLYPLTNTKSVIK